MSTKHSSPENDTDLRLLVDIVWNHATESTAVPSTKTADMLIAKYRQCFGAPAQCAPKPVGFCDALEIVEQGFKTWREKPHNKKWVRHIDGTPIPNDVMVNIAEAISHSSLTSTVQQPVENKKGGAVWPTGTGNTPQDVQLTSLVMRSESSTDHSPPVFKAPQKSAESGPAVTPDCAGGETVTRPECCEHGVKIGNTCVGCLGAAVTSHERKTEGGA